MKTVWQEMAEQIEAGCHHADGCCGNERCYCDSPSFDLARCAEIIEERFALMLKENKS